MTGGLKEVVVVGVEMKKTRVGRAAEVGRRRWRRGWTLLLSSWRRPFLQAVDGLDEEAWERREGRLRGTGGALFVELRCREKRS